MLGKYDRELMREIWAAAINEAPSLTRELLRLDRMLMDQLAELLRRYQQRGVLDQALPVEHAARLLFGAGTALMMAYLADDEVTPEGVEAGVGKMVALSFRDWRAEAVRAEDGDCAALALLAAEVLRFMEELETGLRAVTEGAAGA